jgi:hypothetical protein
MHKFKKIITKTNTNAKRKLLPHKKKCKDETWNSLPQNANMPKNAK